MKISFRLLTLEDLPLLHQWLNKPHVHQFYDKDKTNTMDDINKRYAPKIKGEKPTDCYFALVDGHPFGYIQTYKVNDWPEFGDHLWYDDYTASIDLYIGDEEYIGQGLGQKMISEFLKQVVFASDSDIKTCIIGPEPGNKRAIHVYKKVGFKPVKSVQIPGEDELTYVMEMGREEFLV